MLNFAIEIAREAGNLLVQKLGVAKVSTKGDINLVTEADIAAENLIIERIRSYYPQHGILAEESGEAVLVGGKQSEWKWIIDPLDGTTNYAHGYPCFCVSIALERAGSAGDRSCLRSDAQRDVCGGTRSGSDAQRSTRFVCRQLTS